MRLLQSRFLFLFFSITVPYASFTLLPVYNMITRYSSSDGVGFGIVISRRCVFEWRMDVSVERSAAVVVYSRQASFYFTQQSLTVQDPLSGLLAVSFVCLSACLFLSLWLLA